MIRAPHLMLRHNPLVLPSHNVHQPISVISFCLFHPSGIYIKFCFLRIPSLSLVITSGGEVLSGTRLIPSMVRKCVSCELGTMSPYITATVWATVSVVRYPLFHLVDISAHMLFFPSICSMQHSTCDR